MPFDPYQSHFLIVKDDTGEREERLENSHYSIGRDSECDIRLISQFVSRYHATIEQLANPDGTCSYHIKDGDQNGKPSANGLLINGRRLRAHDLRDRDEVIFGPHVRVIYHLLRRDAYATVPPDEFDITLINPGTAELDNLDE
ncbi:FHA domain-containing protein [Phormidesmis priestleyi]|uniref:FHA domain-containing protein n=1 Tax=Phormidesmis priestleyi TaxID=268141 RepID=UPI00083A44A1|nr:FHA domain-containing protein [Phormidesmis priestleyi]